MTVASDDAAPLRPGALPPRRPSIESLSRSERAERRREGPKTRLTQKLQEDVVAAVRVGTPLHFAYEYAGVTSSTVAHWMRLASDAERRPWKERNQLERRCLLFREALRTAQAEAGLRVHTAIADAAGLTGTRPSSTVTRTRITGASLGPDGRPVPGTGTVVDAVVEVREVPPDWRAAKAIGEYRFPGEMADTSSTPEQPTSGGGSVTGRSLFQRLQEIRQARSEAGIDDSDVIDATVVEPDDALALAVGDTDDSDR